MSSTTVDEQRIAREIEADRKRLAAAIEYGGLPTDAESEKVDDRLYKAWDLIEELVHRVEGIAPNDSEDVPFPVTLEHVGVVATIAGDLRRHAGYLLNAAEKLEGSMSGLTVIRIEQRYQGRQRA